MSLHTFKKKSVAKYGSKRSGMPPGGYWLPQGPFGHATTALENALNHYGPVGFSLQGGRRNKGHVGGEMKMSKSGTPYRGVYAVGFGGTYGRYASATLVGNSETQTTGAIRNAGSRDPVVQPVLNSRVATTRGVQYEYVKPSVLSTRGMLDKKYRWIKHGQYPNYWVQPNYTGNLTGTHSQQNYIENKAAKNTCSLGVNNIGTYEGHVSNCGPTLCRKGRSTAGFTYGSLSSNAPYTKTLHQPVSYSEYNAYLTRGCNNPVGPQKPFPFAVTTGKGLVASGSSITSFGNSCHTSKNIYLAPPEWYTEQTKVPVENGDTPPTEFTFINQWTEPTGVGEPPQTTPFV